jgi:hypothetical protein
LIVGSRGVLFAIEAPVAKRLQEAMGDDDDVMEIIEEIEEAWDKPYLAETDKAWDAIHRALTDGALEWANGEYPLNHTILGGLDLMEGEDYIAVLKSPDQVWDVAVAIREIDDAAMEARYSTNVPSDYAPEYGDDDRGYTVEWFGGVRMLFDSAAKTDRWILFTADG